MAPLAIETIGCRRASGFTAIAGHLVEAGSADGGHLLGGVASNDILFIVIEASLAISCLAIMMDHHFPDQHGRHAGQDAARTRSVRSPIAASSI